MKPTNRNIFIKEMIKSNGIGISEGYYQVVAIGPDVKTIKVDDIVFFIGGIMYKDMIIVDESEVLGIE